jgi:hypothetical protein
MMLQARKAKNAEALNLGSVAEFLENVWTRDQE